MIWYILPNQQIFRSITFSILTKCLCGQDEMASQAGFGPRAVVWRPWLNQCCVTVWSYVMFIQCWSIKY